MKELIIIIITAVFVNNVVLSQFMGICAFLGVSKQLKSSVGMGGAVIFVMVCATACTYPVYLLLDRFEITFLRTVAFILVIAMFVQLIEIVMKKTMPALYRALGVYLPLITTNCAVLGVCIDNINNGYNFAESIAQAFGGGLGFWFALTIMAGVRSKLQDQSRIPKSFQGVPIVLTTASILSLAFLGFQGLFG